jgi:hypothetical protein
MMTSCLPVRHCHICKLLQHSQNGDFGGGPPIYTLKIHCQPGSGASEANSCHKQPAILPTLLAAAAVMGNMHLKQNHTVPVLRHTGPGESEEGGQALCHTASSCALAVVSLPHIKELTPLLAVATRSEGSECCWSSVSTSSCQPVV